VAEVAAVQHAVVSAWQLLELGYSRDWIKHQLGAGRFHRIHRGVYAVGHKRITRSGHWMAAVLACGPLALLSHRTAAALHGLLYPRDGWPHVTVPATGRQKRRGIQIHLVQAIPDEQRTVVDNIPTVTVARALLDLARTKDPLLPYAVETAYDDHLLDLSSLDGQKGVRALKEAVKAYEPTPAWTRSRLEKRFFRLCRKHGLPLPAVNQWIEGYEVDMLWREQKLIVELDTEATHGTRSARRRDPVRDTRLQLAGYRVFRVTDERLIKDPDGVMADVAEALRQAA
jgi:very-short-patch-repair endonuclease